MLTLPEISRILRENKDKYQKCSSKPFCDLDAEKPVVCAIGLLCMELLPRETCVRISEMDEYSATVAAINALERAGHGIDYAVLELSKSNDEAREGELVWNSRWLSGFIWTHNDRYGATFESVADEIDELQMRDEIYDESDS